MTADTRTRAFKRAFAAYAQYQVDGPATTDATVLAMIRRMHGATRDLLAEHPDGASLDLDHRWSCGGNPGEVLSRLSTAPFPDGEHKRNTLVCALSDSLEALLTHAAVGDAVATAAVGKFSEFTPPPVEAPEPWIVDEASDTLTEREQVLLDRVRFGERRQLREDTWVIPTPGVGEPVALMRKLVRLGLLVPDGTYTNPLTGVTKPVYATPGFSAQADALWKTRVRPPAPPLPPPRNIRG